MGLCEFLEDFLSGEEEAVTKYVEPLIITMFSSSPLPPSVLTFASVQLLPIIRNALYDTNLERSVVTAIAVAHVLAYRVPLQAIKDVIERTYSVLRSAYERCGDIVAIFLAEAAMHKALLNSNIRGKPVAESLFREAFDLLKSLEDGSEGYYKSLAKLYAMRADMEIKTGSLRRALSLIKRGLDAAGRANAIKVEIVLYERLVRAYRLMDKEEEARKIIDKLIESIEEAYPKKPAPIINMLSFLYLYTGDERIYEAIEEDLKEIMMPPTPVLTLVNVYRKVLENREEGMRVLGDISKRSDPITSILARILMARVDVNVERVTMTLSRAIDTALRIGNAELALLAVREGEKKGVPKKDLETRRRKIREALKEGY